MKIMITSNSDAMKERLNTLFLEIPGFDIVGNIDDIGETMELVKSLKPHIVVFYFHRIDPTFFNKIKEIKNIDDSPVVIVLSNNSWSEYISRWHDAGADYVFDSSTQVNKMVNLVCGLIYQQRFEEMQFSTAINNYYGPANPLKSATKYNQ